jgi:hypothetical protein
MPGFKVVFLSCSELGPPGKCTGDFLWKVFVSPCFGHFDNAALKSYLVVDVLLDVLKKLCKLVKIKESIKLNTVPFKHMTIYDLTSAYKIWYRSDGHLKNKYFCSF